MRRRAGRLNPGSVSMKRSSIRQKKANKRTVLITVVITVLLVCVLGFGVVRANKRLRDLAAEANAVQSGVETQIAESQALAERQEGGLTIAEIIEIAREKFRLVFPNEIIFVPKDSEK